MDFVFNRIQADGFLDIEKFRFIDSDIGTAFSGRNDKVILRPRTLCGYRGKAAYTITGNGTDGQGLVFYSGEQLFNTDICHSIKPL